jgi:hypothetical protein
MQEMEMERGREKVGEEQTGEEQTRDQRGTAHQAGLVSTHHHQRPVWCKYFIQKSRS